jgi:hypothetical protein
MALKVTKFGPFTSKLSIDLDYRINVDIPCGRGLVWRTTLVATMHRVKGRTDFRAKMEKIQSTAAYQRIYLRRNEKQKLP